MPWTFNFYRYLRLQRITSILEIRKGMLFLDVGCGPAVIAKNITRFGGKVIGIDITKRGSREQALKIAKRDTDFIFILASALLLPFKNDIFNGVICTEVLEHITDDVKVLMEIQRVSAKDGLLYISVPNWHYPFWWDPVNWVLKPFGKHIHEGMWKPGHLRLYSRDDIAAKLQRSSFLPSTHIYMTHALSALLGGIGLTMGEKLKLRRSATYHRIFDYLFKIMLYAEIKMRDNENAVGILITALVKK